MGRYARSVALSVVVALGCASGGTDPDPGSGPGFGEADVTILFVGNSLTSTPDVPHLVRSLAERQGLSVATLTVAQPNFSLEDHWNNGIANTIRSLQPDILVMQQGPSSLPASRDHLVYWSGQLAEVVREVDGEPALYMVWPDATRLGAFGAVESSYAAAAEAVEGRLLPAGTTWLRAWELDEALPLYGDGLHASYLGALAAAQTIYAALFDIDPADMPALDDDLPAARVDLLRSAVWASLEQWHR